MNIRIASTVLPLLLLGLGTAGCDRRDVEPIEQSDTADTVTAETPATTVPDTTTADTAVPPPTPARCAGLTGEAEVDCLMRTNDGVPPVSPPVNPEEDADDAPLE